MLATLRKELRKKASPRKARVLKSFFKTGPGEYGEGDKFLGVTLPEMRTLSLKFLDLKEKETLKLLRSSIHEERLMALLILVAQYEKGSDEERERICKTYLANTRFINNWDLVDLSAHKIVGPHCKNKDKDFLYRLSQSKNLWERRISMVATWHFIRQGRFTEALRISKSLLRDAHDLIHKSVGWMLREVGKKDTQTLEKFLDRYRARMARTTLRYAIERFPEKQRKAYLQSGRRA